MLLAPRFSDFLDADDPAYEVFRAAMGIVFDKGDGTTEHIERLSSDSRLVYLLWCFDGEIHNGGFDQFFVNSLGDHSLEIADALKTVGAEKTHRLLRCAVSWFPGAHPARDREDRWLQYEAFSDNSDYQAQIDELDAEFYKYEDNLAALVNAYVRERPHARIEG